MISVAALLSFGCGHSEAEWQAQLQKYNALEQGSKNREGELNKELTAEKEHVAALEQQLKDAGVDIKKKSNELSKLNMTLEEREKALADYKARAAKLEAIRQRFEMLRKKLDELTKFGLEVKIRRNRMVISLPGDVLFDTGKDTLKKDGEEILKKVATVIKNDKSLHERDYQVAGHTDNQPLKGGVFHDNWGLSLMRARTVLLFLETQGMPRTHWSASGYADTDPIANNGAKEGQAKNRRCDLVVVPDVDEMLDLKAIAQ